ncbi:putative choloylglycine hydrolase [Sporosarcina luteola]|nr:putative choloylglycine hydrolase [Sporosarcina luteola]
MTKELRVRVVELKGDAYQIGVAQGKEILGTQLREQLEFVYNIAHETKAEEARVELQNIAPALLTELEGLADGLETDVETAIRIYAGYDVEFPHMGCTALVQNGFYARNYDFSHELYDARLVFMQPETGYASVGFSQQVTGRLDGMNEKGLVVGLHFVNNRYRGKGFMATTIVRMLLERCADIEEAMELIAQVPHGYCYNYSMTDSSGKAVIVEAAPGRQAVRQLDQLVCTNHFESTELQGMNRDAIAGSLNRKRHAKELANEDLSPLSIYASLNGRKSPLFFQDYESFFGTLHTVIYSPNDLTLLVGVGVDCEPRFVSLHDYIAGKAILPKTICGSIDV